MAALVLLNADDPRRALLVANRDGNVVFPDKEAAGTWLAENATPADSAQIIEL